MSIANNPENIFIPDNIHVVLHKGGGAFLDSSNGQYTGLNESAAELVGLANATGELRSIHDFFAEKFSQCSREEVISRTAEYLQPLVEGGLLAIGEKREPRELFKTARHGGGVPIAMNSETPGFSPKMLGLNRREQIAAIAAIASTRRLLRLPFPVMEQKIRAAREKKPPATHEEAQRAALATSHMSRLYPGRFACMEVTLSTVLFGCRRGFSIDVQFGVAFEPFAFHVWPEAEGRAVYSLSELQASGNPSAYIPLYRI